MFNAVSAQDAPRQPETLDEYLSMAFDISQERGPQAGFDYLNSISQFVNEPRVLFTKAIFAHDADLLPEVERALHQYINIEPSSYVGYNALGYIYAERNIKLEEALSLVKKALELDDNNPMILDSYAWVLYRLGDIPSAIKKMEQAVILVHSTGERPSTEMLAHFGELLWEKGNKKEAVKVWKAAWQVSPEDTYLTKTIARYGIRKDAH